MTQRVFLCERSGFHRREAGVILFVSLIILVALTIAGIALVRSVDTTTLSAGNLTFKQAALAEADVGMRFALAKVVGDKKVGAGTLVAPAITDFENNNVGLNYYASRQPATESGIPVVLFNAPVATDLSSLAQSGVSEFNAQTGYLRRYVIDRLCRASGPATNDNCSISAIAPEDVRNDKDTIPSLTGGAMFRVTVRVDGPKNSVTYTQSFFR